MRPTISTKQLAVSPEGFTIEKEISTPVIPSQVEGTVALLGGFYGDPDKPETASPYLKRYLPKEQPEYTQGQVAAAAFERENTAVATITDVISGRAMDYEEEPDFDPIDFVDQNVTDQTPELFPYQERLLEARSSKEGFAIIDKIKQEQRNDEILGNSGVSGIAWSLAAGVLDPVNLVPIGGSAYKAIKAGKILKGAARTGAVGAGAVATSEGILQGIQETRTAEESAFNIAGGAILGGILGGSASLLSKRKFSKLAKNVEADIQNPSSGIPILVNDNLKVTTIDPNVIAEIPQDIKDFLAKRGSDNLASVKAEIDALTASLSKTTEELQKFDLQKNDLFDARLREVGYPVDVVAGMKQRISEFEAKRLTERTNVNPGKTGKRLRLFDEETNNILSDMKDELDFVLRENDGGRIGEVSRQISQIRGELKAAIKKAEKKRQKLLNVVSDREAALKALEELSVKPEDIAQDAPQIADDLKSVGAAQVDFSPYGLRTYYENKYLPEMETLGRKPKSYKEFAKDVTSLVRTPIGDLVSKLGEKPMKVLDKVNVLNRLNPIQRLMNDKYSVEVKVLAEKLIKNGMTTVKNELGIANAQSVEIAKKQNMAGFYHQYKPTVDKAYKTFRQRTSKGQVSEPDKLIRNSRDFRESLAKVLRNGDTSTIPELQEAAIAARKVLNHLGTEAQKVGLLSENLQIGKAKTALSYFPRLWSRNKIVADEKGLKRIISVAIKERLMPKIKNEMREAELKLLRDVEEAKRNFDKKPTKENEAKLAKAKDKLTELQVEQRIKFEEVGDEAEYIDNITDDIVATLKGEERLGAINDLDIKITNRGPLKERTLDFVMDNEVEKFLENDADQVMRYYSDVMSTDIELARAFDGDVELSKTITQALKEYDEAIAAAKTPEEKIKINKEKLRAENDLTSLVKIMRGQYARPENPDSMLVRGGRIARQYNYITKMGMVTISSLADLVNTTAIHGAPRVFKTLPNLITNIKAIRLNINEAKLAGNITDVVMPERMASFSEAGNLLVSNKSSFETYLSNTEKAMSKINLMPQWNDFMKGFSSVVTQQRMTGAIKDLVSGKISSNDKTYLAFLGIGEQEAKGIAKMLDQFSYKEKNLLVANTEKWTDLEAKRIYRNALNTDVDRTIVSMGAGDIPLWMNTEMGKVIGQFKSFAFASTQQILIGRLQQKDLAALTGFAGAIAMGMFSFYLKRTIQGKELPNDPNVWLVEGIDRSGYLGIMSEFTNIANKVSRGSFSVGATPSRYASRNVAASLAGPSVGLIDDSATTIGALMTQDISEGDAKAMWRMIPFNNVAYFTALQEKFVESVANK